MKYYVSLRRLYALLNAGQGVSRAIYAARLCQALTQIQTEKGTHYMWGVASCSLSAVCNAQVFSVSGQRRKAPLHGAGGFQAGSEQGS